MACGEQASDWAYDGEDPDELHEDVGGGIAPLAYSQKAEHYRALCRRCHRKESRGSHGPRSRPPSVLALISDEVAKPIDPNPLNTAAGILNDFMREHQA